MRLKKSDAIINDKKIRMKEHGYEEVDELHFYCRVIIIPNF